MNKKTESKTKLIIFSICGSIAVPVFVIIFFVLVVAIQELAVFYISPNNTYEFKRPEIIINFVAESYKLFGIVGMVAGGCYWKVLDYDG